MSRLLGETSAKAYSRAFDDERAGAIYAGPTFDVRLPHAGSPLRRPLLTADEVRRLPDDSLLLFIAGCAPVRAAKVRYCADREFAEWCRNRRRPLGDAWHD